MKTICFYHKSDYDGICSAAIVRQKFPDALFFGVDYDDNLEDFLDVEPGDRVIVVDYHFPMEDMLQLDKDNELIWIDHHISAIKEAAELNFKVPGCLLDGTAACVLTWRYFMSQTVPIAVQLLGLYDTWRLSEEVLIFQYGLKYENLTVDDSRWGTLFYDANMYIHDIMHLGSIVYRWAQIDNAKYVHAYSFLAELEGYKVIACNVGERSSLLFDSIWDPERHDIMSTFVSFADHTVVSLYTRKDNIDCSAIAKKFGGGGHRQAAGFRCTKLPFIIPGRDDGKA